MFSCKFSLAIEIAFAIFQISSSSFLQPFTVFNLDSSEERGGSSLSNSMEARFAVQLYQNLVKEFGIYVSTSKVSAYSAKRSRATLVPS